MPPCGRTSWPTPANGWARPRACCTRRCTAASRAASTSSTASRTSSSSSTRRSTRVPTSGRKRWFARSSSRRGPCSWGRTSCRTTRWSRRRGTATASRWATFRACCRARVRPAGPGCQPAHRRHADRLSFTGAARRGFTETERRKRLLGRTSREPGVMRARLSDLKWHSILSALDRAPAVCAVGSRRCLVREPRRDRDAGGQRHLATRADAHVARPRPPRRQAGERQPRDRAGAVGRGQGRRRGPLLVGHQGAGPRRWSRLAAAAVEGGPRLRVQRRGGVARGDRFPHRPATAAR